MLWTCTKKWEGTNGNGEEMTTNAKRRWGTSKNEVGDDKGHRKNDKPCEENNKKHLAHCFFQFPLDMSKSKIKPIP